MHRGKQTQNTTIALKKVRAIYLELNLDNFQSNFKTFIAIYSRSVSGFDDGTKMCLFAHLDLEKSDKAKGKLTKAYE